MEGKSVAGKGGARGFLWRWRLILGRWRIKKGQWRRGRGIFVMVEGNMTVVEDEDSGGSNQFLVGVGKKEKR